MQLLWSQQITNFIFWRDVGYASGNTYGFSFLLFIMILFIILLRFTFYNWYLICIYFKVCTSFSYFFIFTLCVCMYKQRSKDKLQKSVSQFLLPPGGFQWLNPDHQSLPSQLHQQPTTLFFSIVTKVCNNSHNFQIIYISLKRNSVFTSTVCPSSSPLSLKALGDESSFYSMLLLNSISLLFIYFTS